MYSETFKKETIELYEKGMIPIDIFVQAGFNIETIGKENPSKYYQNGIVELGTKQIKQTINYQLNILLN